MSFKLMQYISDLMKNAEYSYDKSIKSWAGWIKGLPGVYAQGESVEEVRSELMSVLEDFLLLELQDNIKRLKKQNNAETNKPERVSA